VRVLPLALSLLLSEPPPPSLSPSLSPSLFLRYGVSNVCVPLALSCHNSTLMFCNNPPSFSLSATLHYSPVFLTQYPQFCHLFSVLLSTKPVARCPGLLLPAFAWPVSDDGGVHDRIDGFAVILQ
jgi:hypothetical protein